MNKGNLIVPGSKEAIDKMKQELENEISINKNKSSNKYDLYNIRSIKTF